MYIFLKKYVKYVNKSLNHNKFLCKLFIIYLVSMTNIRVKLT